MYYYKIREKRACTKPQSRAFLWQNNGIWFFRVFQLVCQFLNNIKQKSNKRNTIRYFFGTSIHQRERTQTHARTRSLWFQSFVSDANLGDLHAHAQEFTLHRVATNHTKSHFPQTLKERARALRSSAIDETSRRATRSSMRRRGLKKPCRIPWPSSIHPRAQYISFVRVETIRLALIHYYYHYYCCYIFKLTHPVFARQFVHFPCLRVSYGYGSPVRFAGILAFFPFASSPGTTEYHHVTTYHPQTPPSLSIDRAGCHTKRQQTELKRMNSRYTYVSV